jgi:vancomycin resistance protein VanW
MAMTSRAYRAIEFEHDPQGPRSFKYLPPGLAFAMVVLAFGGLMALSPRERVVAGYATTLEGRSHDQRHNAIRALHKLDGAVIGPGEVFSFNQRVGTFSRDAGYNRAPVSFNGQLIDSWGGGVCQSSTTLYNAALLAGLQVVERTHHQFCPHYVPPGRDAAVAYREIDLKLKNPYDFPVKIHTCSNRNSLLVQFLADRDLPKAVQVTEYVRDVINPQEFVIGGTRRQGRVRNSGKPGYDVAVFRTVGNQRELISHDSYPVMHRVVQFGS